MLRRFTGKEKETLTYLRDLMRKHDRHESLETIVHIETSHLMGIPYRRAADLWDTWREEWEDADFYSNTHDFVEGWIENEAMCLEEENDKGPKHF